MLFADKICGQHEPSSPPSAVYMRQLTESSLGQVMACRLLGAKPLPETGNLGTNLSEIGIKIRKFSFIKMRLKYRLRMAAICPGGRGMSYASCCKVDWLYNI